MTTTLQLDDQEIATILAALRYYQENGQGDPMNRSDRIHDIATDMERTISLDSDGIDELCERLNTGEMQSDHITIREVMLMVGVKARQTVYEMMRKNGLPKSANIGRRAFWSRTEVLKWIDERFAARNKEAA